MEKFKMQTNFKKLFQIIFLFRELLLQVENYKILSELLLLQRLQLL